MEFFNLDLGCEMGMSNKRYAKLKAKEAAFTELSNYEIERGNFNKAARYNNKASRAGAKTFAAENGL